MDGRHRRRSGRVSLGLAFIGAVAASLAGCVGEGPATSPGMTVPAGQVVVLDEIQFQQHDVNIEVGSTVTWENQDQVDHTATHGTGGTPHGDLLFDFELSPGQQASYTFEEAGNFPVTCRIHPEMQMNVTVAPAP